MEPARKQARLDEQNVNSSQEEENSTVVDALLQFDQEFTTLDQAFERDQKQLLDTYLTQKYALLPQRDAITHTIAGFWPTALKSHPLLGTVIETTDEDLLRTLTDVKVIRMTANDQVHTVRFEFTFGENPFLKNSTLWKEMTTSAAGVSVKNGPIDWQPNRNLLAQASGTSAPHGSFFSFFMDEDPEVGELIENDFYPNAVRYYLEALQGEQGESEEEEVEFESDDEDEGQSAGEEDQIVEISDDQEDDDDDDEEVQGEEEEEESDDE